MAARLPRLDLILIAGAAVFFAGSLAWTLILAGRAEEIAPGPPVLEKPYEPRNLVPPETRTNRWQPPEPTEPGSAWLFDVFTPPVIYYDVASREFSVTPPVPNAVESRTGERPFGLELVEVRRTPYRLQLVGYVGSAGDYLVTFENVETGATVLGREGRTYEDAGFELLRFTVQRLEEGEGGRRTVFDAATAVIRDLRLNREVTLSSRERLMNDDPVAVLRPASDRLRLIEAASGASVVVGGETFTVGQIVAAPPSVEVIRQAAGDRPALVQRLTPAHAAPIAPPPSLFPFPGDPAPSGTP